MNKISSKSIFILWTISVIIILNGLIYYQSKKATDNVAFAVKYNKETSQNPSSFSVLSYEEFSKHNSSGNCWLAIDNKIYDVTGYLKIHPGGSETITPFCGQDATKVFADKPHSKSAYDLLTQYYLGDIDQKMEQKVGKSETGSVLDFLLQLFIGKKTSGSDFGSPQPYWQNNSELAVNSNAPVPIENNIAPQSPSPAPVTATPQANSPQSLTPASKQNPAKTALAYTSAQVAAHNTSSNCWMIVNNKIYNVSGFLNKHSGGSSTMTPYCGKDATAIFVNKPHPETDINVLAPYHVGELKNNSITPISTPIITPSPTATPAPAPTTTPVPTATITPLPTPLPGPSSSPSPAKTYTINVTESGSFDISSLTINRGDIVQFQYIPPIDDEIIIRFAPAPPPSMKLDHDALLRSYTFSQTGTWTFGSQSDQGTITVK